MIAAKLKLRGIDDWGNGAFKAPRGEKKHKGVDYSFDVLEILSPCIGKVTKLGYPYDYEIHGFNYRYVEITDLTGLRHRVMYINPTVEVGQQVTILNGIGTTQNISSKFHNPNREPMIPHVHYEILDKQNQPINPEKFHNGIS